MDERYVFRRTERGAAELASRTSLLSPKHRRCLLLVDGQRSLRDLAASFRPGELGPILRELVERGFLAAPGEGGAAIEDCAARIAFIDENRFADVQRRAAREVADRFGPVGNPLVTQINACARPEQLRIALRTLEKSLQGLAGADYAKDFVKRIGQELMGPRAPE